MRIKYAEFVTSVTNMLEHGPVADTVVMKNCAQLTSKKVLTFKGRSLIQAWSLQRCLFDSSHLCLQCFFSFCSHSLLHESVFLDLSFYANLSNQLTPSRIKLIKKSYSPSVRLIASS